MTNPSKRQESAREWIIFTTELRSLIDSAPTDRTFAQRAKERLTARHTEARVRELRRELHSTKQYMEQLSVGADLHEWGVLSGGELGSRRTGSQTFLLENTLEELTMSSETAIEAADQARHLLAILPAARAAAELGDNSVVADLETRLMSLAESTDLVPRQRRLVLEHLPARLRPIPESLKYLDSMESERGLHPVTLFISIQGEGMPYSHPEGPYIRLDDIVVDRELRGKGLGTAALIELCRYVDLHDLPIKGMLEPGPGKPDETVATLSRWYARMGFTQGNCQPDQWLRRGPIYRSPCRTGP